MNRVLLVCMVISLLSGLTLMFVASSDESRFIDPDSNDYINLADSLVAGKGYSQDGEPEIFRAPGYPLLIAPLRWAFPGTVLPIVVLQIIINASTLLILWHLAGKVFSPSPKIAKFATVLQTASLSSVVFANKILSETAFTFSLMLFLLLLEVLRTEMSRKLSPRTVATSFALGLCGGILILARAIFIPLMLLSIAYLWTARANGPRPRKETLLRKLAVTAIVLAPFIAIYAGWSWRNHATADYSGFSSVGKINIYRYYSCQLIAKDNNISFAEQQGICTANLLACGTQAKQAEYAIKHGLPIIKNQPLRYAMMHLKSDINSLLPAVGDLCKLIGIQAGEKGTLSVIHTEGIISGVKHYFAGNLWLLLLALPFSAALGIRYCAGIAGIYGIFKPEFNITLLFYLLIAAYLLIIPGAVSHPRFRVPVEPIISLFAAIGINNIIQTLKKRAV